MSKSLGHIEAIQTARAALQAVGEIDFRFLNDAKRSGDTWFIRFGGERDENAALTLDAVTGEVINIDITRKSPLERYKLDLMEIKKMMLPAFAGKEKF